MENTSLTEIIRKYGTSFSLSRFQDLDRNLSAIETKHADIMKVTSDLNERLESFDRKKEEWFDVRSNEIKQSMEKQSNEIAESIENAKQALSHDFWLKIAEVALSADQKNQDLAAEIRNAVLLADEKANATASFAKSESDRIGQDVKRETSSIEALFRTEIEKLRAESKLEVEKNQNLFIEGERKMSEMQKKHDDEITALQSRYQSLVVQIEEARKRFELYCRILALGLAVAVVLIFVIR